ncbi:MAG: hypothetical protein RR949_05680 [Oscillospiraceae bacterium]
MKKYYICYWNDFGNTYNLYSVESSADAAALEKLGDCERITLKEARRVISQERDARKYDSAFSGYGATQIIPASIAANPVLLERWHNDFG